MKKYPGIKLKVYCRSMENLMEMLEHGQLDVALSYKPLESYEDIDSHILFNSKLCVIAGKDNPVAKMESIRLTELEKLPLALPARGLQARNALTVCSTARTSSLMSVWKSTISACFWKWSPAPAS